MHYILKDKDKIVNTSFKCEGKPNVLVESHLKGCHRSKVPAI